MNYIHLTQTERYQIYALRKAGQTQKQIAAILKRRESTICRELQRNTVRRYLRSETKDPAYAERQTISAIDKYALQISSWLETEAGKNRKQRRSLKQLHLDPKDLGFEGSYDRVAAFARKWKMDQTDRVNSASKRTSRCSIVVKAGNYCHISGYRPTILCHHGKLKSRPNVLAKTRVKSPRPRSDSMKIAATLPPARSTACFSITFSFFP